MKMQNVPCRDKRPTFYSETTSVKEAKRKASLIISKLKELNAENIVEEFNYVTPNGTYVFHRIKKYRADDTFYLTQWQ